MKIFYKLILVFQVIILSNVAVFNYSDKPKELALDSKRLGLSDQKYRVAEILQANNTDIPAKLNAADAALYKFEFGK